MIGRRPTPTDGAFDRVASVARRPRWNALDKNPLIRIEIKRKPSQGSATPDLVLRHVAKGLLYDVFDPDLQFGERYGRA